MAAYKQQLTTFDPPVGTLDDLPVTPHVSDKSKPSPLAEDDNGIVTTVSESLLLMNASTIVLYNQLSSSQY